MSAYTVGVNSSDAHKSCCVAQSWISSLEMKPAVVTTFNEMTTCCWFSGSSALLNHLAANLWLSQLFWNSTELLLWCSKSPQTIFKKKIHLWCLFPEIRDLVSSVTFSLTWLQWLSVCCCVFQHLLIHVSHIPLPFMPHQATEMSLGCLCFSDVVDFLLFLLNHSTSFFNSLKSHNPCCFPTCVHGFFSRNNT